MADFLFTKTLEWMKTTLSDGIDRVFQIPTAFSAGFMQYSQHATRRIFGSSEPLSVIPARGGPRFCRSGNHIAFVYVMNQMEQSLLPTEKSLRLVDAIYFRKVSTIFFFFFFFFFFFY